MDLVTDPVLLSELYKLFESYERTVEVLGYNLCELELGIKKREIDKIQLEQKLNKQKATDTDKIDYALLCQSLQNDMLTYKVIEADKQHYWSIIDDAYRKTVDLENKVNKSMEEIKNKLLDEEQFVTRK